MGKNNINSYKDFRDSKKVISFAQENGVEYREAKGSHFRLKSGEYAETGYHGKISDGVARKLFKFFVKIGLLVLPFVLYFFYLLGTKQVFIVW